MKMECIIVVFSVVTLGCGSSYVVSSSPDSESQSFSEFNEFSSDREGTVVFHPDSTLTAKEIRASTDSTSFVIVKSTKRIVVATHLIKEIVFRNHGLGAFEGFGLGLLSGGVLGVITAAIAVGQPHDLEGLAYIILPGIGGAVGGLIGLVAGATGGHTSRYVFSDSTHGLPESQERQTIRIEKSSARTDIVYLKNGKTIRGTIRVILIEKPSTKVLVRYVKNGSIDRDRIIAQLEEGSQVKRVTIRSEGGEDLACEASEIERIEIAD